MKNYKVNPEVTNVEFRISVPAVELTRLGWEFNAPEYEGDINLLFTNHGTDNGVVCLWSFDIDGADCEDSGDTEKSIEDVLELLNNGTIEYNEDLDYSENGEGYCSWVISLIPTSGINDIVEYIVSHKNCDLDIQDIDRISIEESGHHAYPVSVRVYSSKYGQDRMGGKQPLFNVGCTGINHGYTAEWEWEGTPLGVIYQK